jgi:hypothetical protein
MASAIRTRICVAGFFVLLSISGALFANFVLAAMMPELENARPLCLLLICDYGVKIC